MNKESKVIRMILFGLSVTSFSIAAGVYIWQLYKTASSMPVFIMLSVFLILPAMMISHQNSRIAAEKAKAQSEFLSNMSHEIRTPLNGLIGLNHMMMLNIDKVEQEQQKEKRRAQHKIMGMHHRKSGFGNKVIELGKFPIKYTAGHCKNGIQQRGVYVTFHSDSSRHNSDTVKNGC